MGKAQKEKGSRREREFASIIGGQRIPLSGSAKHAGEAHAGDVDGLGMRWEVKARRDGFKLLYAWLDQEHVDALALKADRREWLVVLPVQTLVDLMIGIPKNGGSLCGSASYIETESEASSGSLLTPKTSED
nr:hypothetical protein [Paludifilum halophilum]